MTVKEGGALAVQSAQALANNFVVEEGVLALGTTARTADARERSLLMPRQRTKMLPPPP